MERVECVRGRVWSGEWEESGVERVECVSGEKEECVSGEKVECVRGKSGACEWRE